MKSVIIDRLIQIEDSAREITKDVTEREYDLPVTIQKETSEIEQRIKSDYEKRSKEIAAAKEKECEERLLEIDDDAKERLRKLDVYFASNREAWEDEIFNAIIGR